MSWSPPPSSSHPPPSPSHPPHDHQSPPHPPHESWVMITNHQPILLSLILGQSSWWRSNLARTIVRRWPRGLPTLDQVIEPSRLNCESACGRIGYLTIVYENGGDFYSHFFLVGVKTLICLKFNFYYLFSILCSGRPTTHQLHSADPHCSDHVKPTQRT